MNQMRSIFNSTVKNPVIATFPCLLLSPLSPSLSLSLTLPVSFSINSFIVVP